jgi:hypothetical protein
MGDAVIIAAVARLFFFGFCDSIYAAARRSQTPFA